ncbi:zinc-dependent peptidase [Seongchinamella sediminis]|uniref:Zinc-dependent peptidase n=1 Tax=Seongchinamella sediminis TaxID=2283635 RepID=A0A3L7E170_9GAMM|nr:M90 family metallopeptidase [Seongchinamella sediminis]RLQ22480.1 zinc-dependent peptidase [Seongchinamella sediminis]
MIALVPIGVAIAAFFLYLGYNRWRDWSVYRRPFPASWLATLESGLPVYAALSPQQQSRLRDMIKFFIDRKRFYGCAGLTVTDDMRVIIAAEACLLVLNRGGALYPKLRSILVYPTAFRVEREQHQADGTVVAGGHNLLGESWDNGRVILSWDDVTRGVADFSDGHNVVLHEFAHQLDAESGSTNGAPPLRGNSYRAWASIFGDNYADLELRSLRGLETVMDEYGATNPAEFFAVATETFFEKPHQLYKKRPELYAQLQQYYQLDPREWRL